MIFTTPQILKHLHGLQSSHCICSAFLQAVGAIHTLYVSPDSTSMIRLPPVFFASLAREDSDARGTTRRTAPAIAPANSSGGIPNASASSSTCRSTPDRGHHDFRPKHGKPALHQARTKFHIGLTELDVLVVALRASIATTVLR